jgi:DNA-directed RNA polymerase specialized sigma24 family protein
MDPVTFAILWKLIYSLLSSLAHRWWVRPGDVEDVLQETAIRLYKVQWTSGSDQAAFRKCACKILRQLCIDKLRRRKRRPDPQPLEDGADVPGADGVEQLLARLEYEEALAFALNPSRPCYLGPRGDTWLT